MVCRTRRADGSMHRAARAPDGSWYLGRGVGRGLWWCNDGGCADELSAHHVARGLRRSADGVDVEALRRLATKKRL